MGYIIISQTIKKTKKKQKKTIKLGRIYESNIAKRGAYLL